MSQDAIPVNFFTRKELQALIDRAIGLHQSCTDKSMQRALGRIIEGAASVDAALADLSGVLAEDPRFATIFGDQDGQRYDWHGSQFTVHTVRGLFFLAVEQQVMIQRARETMICGLGRYRLITGDPKAPPVYATRLWDLRPYAEKYLSHYQDHLDEDSEDLLERVFGTEPPDLP